MIFVFITDIRQTRRFLIRRRVAAVDNRHLQQQRLLTLNTEKKRVKDGRKKETIGPKNV